MLILPLNAHFPFPPTERSVSEPLLSLPIEPKTVIGGRVGIFGLKVRQFGFRYGSIIFSSVTLEKIFKFLESWFPNLESGKIPIF